MNTRRVGALALTLVLAAIPASAQDARVEAARREGKVVWYTSLALSSSERVAKLFEAAYPGIGVEVHRTGSQRILQRVMQELQANLKLVDVIHTSDAGHFVLLKAKKLLMKYTPAGVEGPGRLLLWSARDGQRHRIQLEGHPGGGGAEDLEGSPRPEVEGQACHRSPRLQRRHR